MGCQLKVQETSVNYIGRVSTDLGRRKLGRGTALMACLRLTSTTHDAAMSTGPNPPYMNWADLGEKAAPALAEHERRPVRDHYLDRSRCAGFAPGAPRLPARACRNEDPGRNLMRASSGQRGWSGRLTMMGGGGPKGAASGRTRSVFSFTPQSFLHLLALPSYPDLGCRLPWPRNVADLIEAARKPTSIHIADRMRPEFLVRRLRASNGLPFTHGFPTPCLFPEYVFGGARRSRNRW